MYLNKQIYRFKQTKIQAMYIHRQRYLPCTVYTQRCTPCIYTGRDTQQLQAQRKIRPQSLHTERNKLHMHSYIQWYTRAHMRIRTRSLHTHEHCNLSLLPFPLSFLLRQDQVIHISKKKKENIFFIAVDDDNISIHHIRHSSVYSRHDKCKKEREKQENRDREEETHGKIGKRKEREKQRKIREQKERENTEKIEKERKRQKKQRKIERSTDQDIEIEKDREKHRVKDKKRIYFTDQANHFR